jgi:hypothetical protein
MRYINVPLICIFSFYHYYITPNLFYVLSYIIQHTINNNSIKFISGIVCINYIDDIIVNVKHNLLIKNYNILYVLSLLLIHINFFEIYINTIFSGIKTIIDLINEFILTNEYVIGGTFGDVFINTLKYLFEKSNNQERLNMINNFNHIQLRLTSLQSNLLHIYNFTNNENGNDDNLNDGNDDNLNDRNDDNLNGGNDGNDDDLNNGNDENRFETFINELNDLYPLRCKGLDNNDNDRIDNDKCNICLEDLDYNQLYRTIRCSHSFHPQCIDKWLFLSKVCPICRDNCY